MKEDKRTMTFRRVIFDDEQGDSNRFRALQEIRKKDHPMLYNFLEFIIAKHGNFGFDDKELEVQFAKLNREMHNTKTMVIDKGFKVKEENIEINKK